MFAILQYLAVSPLLLGSMLLSTVPTTSALSISPRHASHGSLARRLAASDFKHVKKDMSDFKHVKKNAKQQKRVRKRGNGSCRVRPANATTTATQQAYATVSASSEVVSVTSTYSADASSTDTPAAYPSSTDTPQAWTSAYSSSVEAAASSSSVWTSAAAAAPTSTDTGASTNTGSGFGLAWPNGDWAAQGESNYVGNYVGKKTSWYYTWSGSHCPKADALGIEFVPMMWGVKDANSAWTDTQSNWPSSTQHVLFFNEPNDAGQSDISAADAVQYWTQYISPLKQKGYKIGMAATTSAPSGLQWVLDFKAACPSCWDETDFVPLHYYDTDVGRFQSYVQNYHDKVQKPIWVTEYACQDYNGGAQCSWDQTMNFHYQMADWFNAQDYVERFAPFGAMQSMQGVNDANRLMNADGSITALGEWYINNA